jgi:hypothetical protein
MDDAIWDDPCVSTPPRTRRPGRLILVVALVSVIAFTAAASILSRRDYGTFDFRAAPTRINYCGRRYYRGGSVQGTPRSFSATIEGHPTWQTVGRTFALRPIEALRVHAGSTSVCAMTFYVPTGRRSYIAYNLSGGP